MTALVLYATTHGHTAKIAARIAQALEASGVTADLRAVADGDPPLPNGYDGVVLAASVHGGRHQAEIVRYARDHHTLLNEVPTAFVSVSLSAADDTDESAAATRRMVDDFLDDTGLIPAAVECVAGCLQYREYDFMTRLVMRMLTRTHPEAQDVHADHEYTDWERVDAFAAEFAGRLGA